MRQITVPALIKYLSNVQDFIADALTEAGIDEMRQNLLFIAVEEVFVNIANYAYLSGEGDVSIRADAENDMVFLEFSDSGAPYDPTSREAPDISLPAEQRAIGGLGIHMVKEIMDTAEYRRENGRNILTLKKSYSEKTDAVKRKRSGVFPLLALIVLALAAGVCLFNGRLMQGIPFMNYGEFKGPTAIFGGESGRTYVIDNGKKDVLILNERDELIYDIRGGDKETGFYYASIVEEGADGSIYIADALYSGQGTRLSAERIFRYDAGGRLTGTVYEILYENPETAPLQYGRIQSLSAQGGELVFTVLEENAVTVRALNLNTGGVTERRHELPGNYINRVTAAPNTRLPVFTTRLGEVCGVGPDGGVTLYLPSAAGETPWELYCDGETVYYTDLTYNTLFALNMGTGETRAVIEAEDILYTVHVSGGRVFTTDYGGCFIADGAETRYISQIVNERAGFRVFLWSLAAAGALAALALVIWLIAGALARQTFSATMQRVLIVIVASVSIGSVVSVMILNYMVNSQNSAIMEQLSLFGDILTENTDAEALARLDSLEDYRSGDYQSIKAPLDVLTQMSYNNGLYYYYIIYVTDGEIIYGVLDYEDTMTARHPFYQWGYEGYTDVLADGETVTVSADVSSYGSWSFVLKPIYGAGGTPFAVMEVGVSLDDLNSRNRALVVEIVLSVAAIAAVLLMVILEFIFFAERAEQKRGAGAVRGYPLRTLIFLIFLANCMQDAFVAVLANQLYTPLWGLPRSVGAALPLSAELLFSAVSAFTCGTLARKLGVKKTLTAGLLIQTVGYVICGALMTYAGLLGGKAVVGMGMGLVIVSLNTIAARGGDEKQTARAFTNISAGTLAGVTAGSGLGSLVLSFGGYNAVYYTAAAVLVLAFILSQTGAAAPRETAARPADAVGIRRFLTDFKTLSFLGLILTPFLIALSFREYFFPLYAAESGVSEVDTGRIFLLCGLAVIYLGPPLTRALIGRLGAKWTVVAASVVMGAATLLFAFSPSFIAAVIGVALLSVAISFGYTAQSTYYAGLPVVKQFGESQAMGVYSLFDNGGQTLGPAVYGLALVAGTQTGLLIIGATLASLTALFSIFNAKREKSA